MRYKYYLIIFTDYSETTGKQTSKAAMMKDARTYCRIWNLEECVKEVIEISEEEYNRRQNR